VDDILVARAENRHAEVDEGRAPYGLPEDIACPEAEARPINGPDPLLSWA